MRLPRVRVVSAREAEEARRLSSQFAELARLQRQLQSARARYEAALADVQDPATDEGADPGTNGEVAGGATVTMLMTEDREPQERVSLTEATFEELRDLGLSVTQVSRILGLREQGALRGVDDLDSVPGIPRSKLGHLKGRLRD